MRDQLLNVIPPITEPLGRHWDQPDTSLIQIDDEFARMNAHVFRELPEYSTSQPSGVYPGKMWKRHDGAFDHEFIARGGKPDWLLCWYGECSEHPAGCQKCCSNNSRKILVNGVKP